MDKKNINEQIHDENEDAILARIQEESLRYYNEVELPRRAAEIQIENPEYNAQTEIACGEDSFQTCLVNTDKSLQTPLNKDVFYQGVSQGAEGFHMAAGETYIYPTNYPIRKYQKSIIHSALFHNTLVSLPTGLGKTFIAAVLMYNYYRWFPQGKIVFMAPTRPLVAQQIRACHDIMAIPIKDTVEMTGTMNPSERQQQWKSKRVFFLTPQVMVNDLRNGICPACFFKCVVIDEAHRATKEYAYCHVIKELEQAGAVFRVLALSATPGSNTRAVIEVVQNLRISTLELRGEESPDVAPYTHTKCIEPVSLSLSKPIIEFREQFLLIFERYAKSLREARLITCNVQNLTKFQLLKSSDRLRNKPPSTMSKAKIGFMMSDFTVCMTLAHGLELLQTYGLRAFSQYFTCCDEEETRKAAFTRLKQDVDFQMFLEKLHNYISSPMDKLWSHPKHEHLVKILKDHFIKAEESQNSTKVIIFCQYRVVVSEVYELLQNLHPLIKPVMFVGQGVGKDKSGLPQKKQIEVMKQFREGLSNVLIATCVAEEGLDIGSVDLLVLMEVQRSPVRLVQRLGRTGRHRQGRCVVLLTQGREVQKFHEAMATRNSFLSTIQNSKVLANSLYKAEPSMVPSTFIPKIQLVHVNVPQRVTPGKSKKQSDIRQALLSKLNNSEEQVETPLLSTDQVTLVKEEMKSLQMNYDKLKNTSSEYLFNRLKSPPMESEELFSAAFCQQSNYIDWNRTLQQTYLLSHSSDTEMLCHLMEKVENMKMDNHSDLSSQISINNINFHKNKSLKNKIKFTTENVVLKNKKKGDKEEKHGMDIRECMSLASGKARLLPDVQKEDINFSESTSAQSCGNFKSLPDIQSEQIISNNNPKTKEDSNEQGCIFCEKGVKLKSNLCKSPKHLGDHLTQFTLDQLASVEKFVKDVSKEVILNINILGMFSNSNKYMREMTSSITVLKQQLKLSHVKKPPPAEDFKNFESLLKVEIQTSAPGLSLKQKSPHINGKIYDSNGEFEKVPNNKTSGLEPVLFDVNDIFEHEFEGSPKVFSPFKLLSSNFESKKSTIRSDVQHKTPLCASPKNNYFNLDDIFNEDSDDLPFVNMTNDTKTSTPIDCKKLLSTITTDICSDLVTSTTKDIEVSCQMSENRSTTQTSKECSSSNKTFYALSGCQSKNVFKIPQVKLIPDLLSSQSKVTNLDNENKALSPLSPILSGQISSKKFVNDLSNQIPESPILSGQVENQVPINFSAKPRIECRALFNEGKSLKKQESSNDFTLLCNPLDISKTENEVSTENENHILSASQLFDDESNEEDKNNTLEQSSMYTITQMVNKISALAENTKSKNVTQSLLTTEKNISPVDWGSFEEDYLLENINLDNLANEASRSNVNNIKPQDSVNTSNSQNKLDNSSLNVTVEASVGLKPLVGNNQNPGGSKILHCSVSGSVDEESEKPLKKTGKINQDSLITSRWLSCMKSPLNEPKKSTILLGEPSSPSNSDSNSDVFQSPVLKKRIIMPRKTGAKKQRRKGLFVELEADVSGPPCSSDEENTSGLDDLDESFINDMTEHPNTSVDQTALDIEAKYLQSIKSPVRKAGGYKIPTISDGVMDINVFSQVVEDDDDSYLNDSFCCDATEIHIDEDPSVLEIAEQILNKNKTKKNKRKKRHKRMMSRSSSESEEKCLKRRFITSESSFEDNGKYNRKRLLSSSSSSCDETKRVNKLLKRRKKLHLLTSDSDSTV